MGKDKLNVKIEKAAKAELEKYLVKSGYDRQYIQGQLSFLFDTGGFNERFDLLNRFTENRSSILISGSAIGSELLIAKNYGYKNVTGTEVVHDYVSISNKRLRNYKKIQTIFYSGDYLKNFKNGSFSCVMSSHIIEHTSNPELYLTEHFRVLKSNGIFYLEFPTRYNLLELHTRTFSFEWLPIGIRNLILSLLSGPINPNKGSRHTFLAILETLSPVSVFQIRTWLRRNNIRYKILTIQYPHKGIIRMIIKKY
ncbi:methyltransferase domain-containing protein [Candidatus Dojkabacteria bacterium]|nr:methyltransferase domain-containing protein [Candidatus Dojkabacteria bacterium]